MSKLIFILFGLVILVSSCRKDPHLIEESQEPVHFLDPYVGTYEGTLDYSIDDKIYGSTWDLQCTQNLIFFEDTSYQVQTTVTVSRDSAFVITIDDEFDEMDRTFEIDSVLYYLYSTGNGWSADHYYHYHFIQNGDSMYLHSDLNVSNYSCRWTFEDYRFSLKKVQ